NKRRCQLAIRGVFVDGIWRSDPIIDAKFDNDFRPISQIRCVYKVVSKVLANRLVSVIEDLVSDTQSAFVAGRQILDGHFILDEILKWCKRMGKQAESLHLLFSRVAADSIGCSILNNQFQYLGVMVGDIMPRLKALDDIILKIKSRLSKWKVKTLSIGRRLTLLKLVLGASPIYAMSIFKVPRGVSSFFALNRALLLKWVWQFVSQDGSFWCKQIGNGADIRFWYDCWFGDIPFCIKYPRLFALELDKHVSVESKLLSSMESSFRRNVRGGIEQYTLEEVTSTLETVSLSNSSDRWICDLTSDGVFRVKERAHQDCLPTRVNLVRRGINVDSCVCPICSTGEDEINHILFRCDLAQQHGGIYGRLGIASFLRDFFLDVLRFSSKSKSLLEGTFFVAWWHIWKIMNRIIFEGVLPRRSDVFDNIIFCAFNWCDKVLQELSTSRFWFKEGNLVVKFDRFEQGFRQRVFFDIFVQGFSVRVLLSSRILSTSLLLGFQFLIRGSALETGLLDFLAFLFLNDKVAAGGYKHVNVLKFFDCPGLRQGVEDLRGLLHKGAQGDREAEVFQVSNDDTTVAQRRMDDKQLEEKTNTDCLRSTQQCMKSGVTKHLGVAGLQQQNGLVDETNVTLFAKVRCFLIQAGLSKVFWEEDTTKSTYLVNRSPSSAIGFKKPIDMLGVLHGFELEVEPLGDHTFEVEPQDNIDQRVGLQKLLEWRRFMHESLTFNNTVASTVARNAVTTTMAITESIHQGSLSGDCDVKKNDKWSCIYAVGSQEYQMVCTRLDIASADVGSLKANLQHMEALSTTEARYMTFTEARKKEIWLKELSTESRYELRLVKGIATGALVKGGSGQRFQHKLRYGLMILGCAGSLKANLQHMEALSTTKARYMTFTEARKKEIWLKELSTELRYELRLVKGIATGALVKGGSGPRFQHKLRLLRIDID
nr:hypothetical protein [Tanacetum cinerariifolium]